MYNVSKILEFIILFEDDTNIFHSCVNIVNIMNKKVEILSEWLRGT